MGGTITAAAVVGAAAMLLVGCSATSAADADAAATAARLGTRMSALRLFTADDLGRTAANTQNVTVLSVTGQDARSTGVELVIRVQGDGGTPLGEQEPTTADDCFALDYHNSTNDGTPSEVSCPAGPPITYPPTEQAELPSNIDTLISAALPSIPSGGTATEAMAERVRSTVNGWHLDPGAGRDVALSDNAIGIAVRTPDQCEMGRAAPGSTTVWHVAAEYQPGELTCSADEAAYGAGQTPPH